MSLIRKSLKEELYQHICDTPCLYDHLQKYNKNGIFIWNLDDQDKGWLDPNLKYTLGYDQNKELNQIEWKDHFLRTDLNRLSSEIYKKKDDGILEFKTELRCIHSSGKIRCMEVNFRLIGNKKINRAIGAFKDISSITDKKAELYQQLERYQHIIEGTRIGVWEWNIQTGEIILHEQWAEILGYDPQDLEPATSDIWKKLSHPEDTKKNDKKLEKHLNGFKDFYTCEYRLKHKNGEWIWVKDRGKIVTWTTDGKPEWMTGFYEEIQDVKERLLLKKSFIDHAPSAIAMFDKNMNYLAVSRRWLEDYNLEHINVIGENHYEIFPEINQEWKDIHNRCLKGEIVKREDDRFIRKDGTELWLNWEIRPWYNNEDKIAGIIMHTADVSHARKIERIAQNKQKFLETILKNINVGIISCDEEGKLTLFNDTVREWYGIPDKNIPHSEYSNYYGLYKKDGQTPLKLEEIPLIRALRGESVRNEELVVKLKEGQVKTITVTGSQLKNEIGQVSGAVIAMHDITQRKEVEKRLDFAVARMQALLGASTKTLIVGTDPNGLITFFNRGAENMLGYSNEELLNKGNPGMFHLPEELMELHKELLARTNKSLHGFDLFKELVRQGESTREWTLIKKDGTKFSVQLTITSIKKDKEIVGYLGIGADISEIKRTEKELKSVLKVTQHQNERLKNFAHIVSHNLRSHSGNIEMLLDLFLEENPNIKDDEMILHLQKASSNLKETIAHLNEVVLMNVSVGENLTNLKLSKYIQNAIENLSTSAEKNNVEIESRVPENIKVLGIPAYLDSIILNLISNAIKYRSLERSSYIKLSTTMTSGFVLFEIEDNGIGIDLTKNRRKLFGMYNTFHSNEDARGIGLFITKNQVEAMGGKIDVESELDKGTTFKIYLKYEKN